MLPASQCARCGLCASADGKTVAQRKTHRRPPHTHNNPTPPQKKSNQKKVARRHGLSRAPKLIEIIAAVPEEHRASLLPRLRAKPVRTASGIAVVAVMSKPHRCPHIATTGECEGLGVRGVERDRERGGEASLFPRDLGGRGGNGSGAALLRVPEARVGANGRPRDNQTNQNPPNKQSANIKRHTPTKQNSNNKQQTTIKQSNKQMINQTNNKQQTTIKTHPKTDCINNKATYASTARAAPTLTLSTRPSPTPATSRRL